MSNQIESNQMRNIPPNSTIVGIFTMNSIQLRRNRAEYSAFVSVYPEYQMNQAYILHNFTRFYIRRENAWKIKNLTSIRLNKKQSKVSYHHASSRHIQLKKIDKNLIILTHTPCGVCFYNFQFRFIIGVVFHF